VFSILNYISMLEEVVFTTVYQVRYDTIVCIYRAVKMTGSQLSPPHGTNEKLKCETKNKTMSVIGNAVTVALAILKNASFHSLCCAAL